LFGLPLRVCTGGALFGGLSLSARYLQRSAHPQKLRTRHSQDPRALGLVV
jgi:hypothetical protein